MRHPMIRLLLLLLPLLCGAASADDVPATAAPDPADTDTAVHPTGDPFVDVVDVNVVNIEVYVTDKKGNRITGLSKDDFELLVDRKPMPIANFYAVEDGRTRLPSSEAAAETPPVDRPRLEIGEPDIPEDQRLHLVVYVDNFNLHPFSRNKVFRFARTWLRQKLSPGDRVMLVSYERSTHVRHPFTTDPELIASQLYELEEMSAMATSFDSDRRDLLRDIYDADELYNIRGRAIQYAESVFNDLRFSVDALGDLVDNLAGLPGRKAILYISDGLSMRAGEDIFYALNDHFQSSEIMMEIHRFDASREFQKVASKANANRVTFYNIDAAGLRTSSYMDVSNSTLAGGPNIDSIHFNNLQSPLIFLAGETGGMTIYNTNNFGPGFDRISEDFTTYYSLGFSTAEESAGRYHKIKVGLKNGKGYDVRSRDGYRDKPLATRMTESTLAALHFGYQRNPLGVTLEVMGTSPSENKFSNVSLRVKIPLGKLAYLPQAEMYRGRVRIWVSAKDEEGRLAPVSQVPVPIDIPAADMERAKEQYFGYEMTLQMRRGRQVVAVGVRDEIGAVTGFAAQGLLVR